MQRRPTTVISAALGIAILAMVVLAAWPRPVDPAVERAYDRLGASPVPVLLPYTPALDPSGARLESDGYVVPLSDPDVGPLTMSGRRPAAADAAASPAGHLQVHGIPAWVVNRPANGENGPATTEIGWQEQGATYTLSFATTPDTALVARLVRRVVTLEDARRAALGDRWDTPLLYLLYLPIFAAYIVWLLYSLSRRPPFVLPSAREEATSAAG